MPKPASPTAVRLPRYAVIVAGGKGLRMGGELPKQFLPLGGKPVLMHTLERFAPLVDELILVLPEAHIAYWQDLCVEYQFDLPVRLALGGETRWHSVRSALAQLPEVGWVAVHDGVRPLVSRALIEACFAEAEEAGAALPALPVTDSLRQRDDVAGSVAVERSRFVAVQTPQTFALDRLQEAYRRSYQETFTDDASVYEAAGFGAPRLVPGEVTNIKLTTPLDLSLAALLLSCPQ